MFILAELIAFSKALFSMIFVVSGSVNPKWKKNTTIQIKYLGVLHSKWLTCFSYLNNCLLAFDYEEIAFQKLVKSCNLFVFGHALNCIGKHYSESPVISDFICFKKLFLYLPPIFGGCIV
jgi:hypothetical protein